ncbi:MAG TPA: ferredoxin, partial [Acidimicrobiales bacterium]|nr:ferredoxin [Acidimicrobiales bacterium]
MIPGLKGAGRAPDRLVATVDGSKCTGQGVCVELAAAGFALDRFGYAYVRPGTSDRAVSDPTLRAALRAAEARCPEGAIRIDKVRAPVTLT